MTDPTPPTATSDAEVAEVTTSRRRKLSWFGSFLKWMIIVFLIMQVIIRTVWEPSWGDALENLITYSQIQLTVLCTLIWWFFSSPYRRTTVMQIGIPILCILIAWMVSIRDIDFNGDMEADVQYRWEPTTEERLAKFRETAKFAPTEKIQLEKTASLSAEDLTGYRGPARDGIVQNPPIRTEWSENPPEELWRHPIGGGYSSFAVVDPVLATMEQRGEFEAVVCYDITSGNEFWEFKYPAAFDALGGPGPRSTPTIHGDVLYSFGCFGDLYCLKLKTGEVSWHVNALQQFGLPTAQWGMTSSPLIYEDTVIVNIGGLNGDGLIAYRLADGELVWWGAGLPDPQQDISEYKTGVAAVEAAAPGKTIPGYASPTLVTIDDQEIILNFDGNAFRGHDPSNGEQLWTPYEFIAGDYINASQPIVFDDDHILISSGYGKGSAILQVSFEEGDWTLSEVRTFTTLRCKFSTPIYYEGYIYGLDEGRMVCIDPASGERRWKGRREGLRGNYGHGQMLLLGDRIVILTESGELVLMRPSPEELLVDDIIEVLNNDVKTWNPLAIAYGKLFARNATEIACYDLRATDETNPDDPNPGETKSNETDVATNEQVTESTSSEQR